ncbi:MAG: hypothetical protein AAF943_05340 [Pseudomonadota bacterium]
MADDPDNVTAKSLDVLTLRARDFWAALALMAASAFFLVKTYAMPFWAPRGGGVTGAGPWASAALVPYGLFSALFILSGILMVISIRGGGARRALQATGIGFDGAELWRLSMLSVMLLAYIVGLVPRVDFAIASALLIQALIFGFHRRGPQRMGMAALAVALPALYAFVMHFPQSAWQAAHDDDWLTLGVFAALALAAFLPRTPRAERVGVIVAMMVPVFLVSAMAFGFRQNVPNRGGLLFEQLQYHYYVTLKPLWAD